MTVFVPRISSPGSPTRWGGGGVRPTPISPRSRGRAERSRLAELRLHADERRAEAHIALGVAAEAMPDLDAHVAEHPWHEDAWHLLALALYRSGRQADALSVVRRARQMLKGHLGVDPGPRLRRLAADLLHQRITWTWDPAERRTGSGPRRQRRTRAPSPPGPGPAWSPRPV